jgi:hypothetical protein
MDGHLQAISDSLPIRTALETLFPADSKKWDKWEGLLIDQDIDTVLNVRSLSDKDFAQLSEVLSVILVKGLKRLRPSHSNNGATERHRHFQDVPLLFLSLIGVVFVLYAGADILVPFTISLFLVYLLRPFYLWLITPFSDCCCSNKNIQYSRIRQSREMELPGDEIYAPVHVFPVFFLLLLSFGLPRTSQSHISLEQLLWFFPSVLVSL